MQYLLEIKDNKVKFLLEILKYFPFVKTYSLSKRDARFINELQGSINQVKKAKKGIIKLQKAEHVINNL